MSFTSIGAALLIASPATYALDSQATPEPAPVMAAAPALTYADAADLALAAPVAAHVRVVRAVALRERDAPGIAAGHRRFLVEADLVSLIRSPATLPTRVGWLVDLPNDSRGRAARLPRRSELILLAAPVPGRPAELRLAAPDSQLPYTVALAERLRAILREAIGRDAPPRIVAIGRAFHVPGAIPGESETQIFLQTAEGRPVSLSVLRRPGEQPRWAVSLAEMVDDSAVAPRSETLLWYRLACGLPRALPAQSLSEASAAEAVSIRGDYRLILESLGPCARNRGPG
ncbi:MAG TPA: hypothetical protein VEW25_06325 [Allosphingosinicella sp.]|nr:hypothetical protein [Allosphingosinicella sp.]